VIGCFLWEQDIYGKESVTNTEELERMGFFCNGKGDVGLDWRKLCAKLFESNEEWGTVWHWGISGKLVV
jgi:hypothetical protein